MKTIGIIGGMSWESTIEYYRIVNQEISSRLGGLYSAKILIESFDFDEIARLQREDNWETILALVVQSAKNLINSGADCIAIATNTVHKVAPEVQKAIGSTPLIHIADATARMAVKQGFNQVALLGTKFTMSGEFYKGKLANYSINTIIPDQIEQDEIHRIIFEELCTGVILENSKNILNKIINNCAQNGAQAVVLGCTELPNIIKSASIPILNTTEIHSLDLVDFALSGERVYA